MNDILNKKIAEYSEKLILENDAESKLTELYDVSLKAAQASISAANQTSSVDDRINSLANGLQSVLDLILEFRNAAKKTKSELRVKIAAVEEIQTDLVDNSPTDAQEKKSQREKLEKSG